MYSKILHLLLMRQEKLQLTAILVCIFLQSRHKSLGKITSDIFPRLYTDELKSFIAEVNNRTDKQIIEIVTNKLYKCNNHNQHIFSRYTQ